MPRLFTLLTLALVGTPAVASPRDELLRAAPQDAALVVLVQNARDHSKQVAESPFAAWFPNTAAGKLLSAPADLKSFGGEVFSALDVTPDEFLADVVGDAFAFAFTPGPNGDEKGEKAVILVRPRKPETLARVIEKLNAHQTKSGEIKGVAKRTHANRAYHERQKGGGPAEFYCFRDGVFAFSTSEADIKSVLERDLASPCDLSKKVTKLGVADAVLVVLINPRPLDAELKAKVTAADADDRIFLERFSEVWHALDSAALYVKVSAGIETGVSVQFKPGELSPRSKGWLTGSRNGGAFWAHVPADAMLAVGGRFQATELIDGIKSLLPDAAKVSLQSSIDDILGPVFGKDKLPAVMGALGPDWGVFVGPPSGGFFPTVVAGVNVEAIGTKPETAQALLQAVDFGFMSARIAYNASHPNQLGIRDTRDGDVVIKSLVNDKVFPPGVQPSFGMKGGYLLIASTPDAIKNFAPRPGAGAAAEATVARFSGTATRAYFQANREKLAKYLSDAGAGNEQELLAQFDQIARVLEPLDRVEIVTRGDDTGMKVALRVTLAKALKK